MWRSFFWASLITLRTICSAGGFPVLGVDIQPTEMYPMSVTVSNGFVPSMVEGSMSEP